MDLNASLDIPDIRLALSAPNGGTDAQAQGIVALAVQHGLAATLIDLEANRADGESAMALLHRLNQVPKDHVLVVRGLRLDQDGETGLRVHEASLICALSERRRGAVLLADPRVWNKDSPQTSALRNRVHGVFPLDDALASARAEVLDGVSATPPGLSL